MGIMNKMKTVNLGTLVWQKYGVEPYALFYATVPNGRTLVGVGGRQVILIDGYDCRQVALNGSAAIHLPTKTACWDATNSQILMRDNAYTDAASFKQAMSGKILTYETIDSVEEKIVSYKQKQLASLILRNNYTYAAGISVSFSNGSVTATILNDSQGDQTAIYKLNVIEDTNHKFYIEYNVELINDTSNGDIRFAFEGCGKTTTQFSNVLSVGKPQKLSLYYSGNGDKALYLYSYRMKSYRGKSGTVYKFSDAMCVDVTEIYGAGNEPATAEQFLSEHPEYKSYVPFYDGPINITEEII